MPPPLPAHPPAALTCHAAGMLSTVRVDRATLARGMSVPPSTRTSASASPSSESACSTRRRTGSTWRGKALRGGEGEGESVNDQCERASPGSGSACSTRLSTGST